MVVERHDGGISAEEFKPVECIVPIDRRLESEHLALSLTLDGQGSLPGMFELIVVFRAVESVRAEVPYRETALKGKVEERGIIFVKKKIF